MATQEIIRRLIRHLLAISNEQCAFFQDSTRFFAFASPILAASIFLCLSPTFSLSFSLSSLLFFFWLCTFLCVFLSSSLSLSHSLFSIFLLSFSFGRMSTEKRRRPSDGTLPSPTDSSFILVDGAGCAFTSSMSAAVRLPAALIVRDSRDKL